MIRAYLDFRTPQANGDPRVWLLIPEIEGWYPLAKDVTRSVQSFEILPGRRFRATLIEWPLKLEGFWIRPYLDTRRCSKVEVEGVYEVQS